MKREFRFSDEYLIRYGWGLDFAEDGNFYMDEPVMVVDDNWAYLIGQYEFEGWIFSKVILTYQLERSIEELSEEEIDNLYAEDIWEICGVENYTFEPSSETEVIQVGAKEAVKGTTFEEFMVYGEGDKNEN